MAATETFAYETTLNLFEAGDTATMENDATKGILEALVDRFQLDVVLSALADVCYDKAAHVQETWQDRALAKAWEKNALKCNAAALGLQPTQ